MSDNLDWLMSWDRLDGACQRVETSLPWQMSDAIRELEAARLAMRATIQSLVRQSTAAGKGGRHG